MRLAPLTFTLSCWLASSSLLAGEASATVPVYSKHMLSECMAKRMYSDKTLSYNDASKACKDQLRGTKTDAALTNPSAQKPVS